MNSRLTQKQKCALKHLMYTGEYTGIHPRTLQSLVRRDLIQNYTYRLTLAGIKTICPDAPDVKPSPEAEEARKVQDELIAAIEERGWPLAQRLSRDMPAEITGVSLIEVVYPEWISEFRRMITQFQRS